MFRDSTTTTTRGQTDVVDGGPMPAVRTIDDEDTVRTVPSRGVVDRPVAASVPAVPMPWAHVSVLATLCLMMGTAAMGATLTGLLAPLGFAAGVVTLILGLAGMGAVRRAGVTGRGLVGLGVLLGGTAMALAVLAIKNQLPWLHSDVNEVANLHDWLSAHVSWLTNW